MAHDVFVSYQKDDLAVAEIICTALETQGILCWMAPRNQLAGRSYGQQITEAIRKARVMVLVFSEHANKSQAVQNEVFIAMEFGAAVLPFKIENIEFNEELEYHLKRLHWLRAFPPPIDNYVGELVKNVKRLLGGEDQSTDLKPVPLPQPPPTDRPREPTVGPTRATAPRLPVRPDPERKKRLLIGGVLCLLLILAAVIVVVSSGRKPAEPAAAEETTNVAPADANETTTTTTKDTKSGPSVNLPSLLPLSEAINQMSYPGGEIWDVKMTIAGADYTGALMIDASGGGRRKAKMIIQYISNGKLLRIGEDCIVERTAAGVRVSCTNVQMLIGNVEYGADRFELNATADTVWVGAIIDSRSSTGTAEFTKRS